MCVRCVQCAYVEDKRTEHFMCCADCRHYQETKNIFLVSVLNWLSGSKKYYKFNYTIIERKNETFWQSENK